MSGPNKEVHKNLMEHAIIMEQDAHQWHSRMNDLMADGARIIAFRGAGAVNGIDPRSADAITETLTTYISSLAEDGTTVAIMFDGDEDNREKPDLGAVFGAVADALKDNPKIAPIAAQTQGWYYPKTTGGALESATGTLFETYVFPDDMPDSHAALTQSPALAKYSGYEQIFVGPAGPIAFNQLQDASIKAVGRPEEAGPMKVTIIETAINPELDRALQAQLDAATDTESSLKIQAKIDQRHENPYGALFTSQGKFKLDLNQYSTLDFQIKQI